LVIGWGFWGRRI